MAVPTATPLEAAVEVNGVSVTFCKRRRELTGPAPAYPAPAPLDEESADPWLEIWKRP